MICFALHSTILNSQFELSCWLHPKLSTIHIISAIALVVSCYCPFMDIFCLHEVGDVYCDMVSLLNFLMLMPALSIIVLSVFLMYLDSLGSCESLLAVATICCAFHLLLVFIKYIFSLTTAFLLGFVLFLSCSWYVGLCMLISLLLSSLIPFGCSGMGWGGVGWGGRSSADIMCQGFFQWCCYRHHFLCHFSVPYFIFPCKSVVWSDSCRSCTLFILFFLLWTYPLHDVTGLWSTGQRVWGTAVLFFIFHYFLLHLIYLISSFVVWGLLLLWSCLF